MEPIHKERILLLADHLDSIPDHQFSLEHWLTGTPRITEDPDDCDTVGCIPGYAVLLFDERGNTDAPWTASEIARKAQHLLGLDDQQGQALFTPTAGGNVRCQLQCNYQDVTPADAADTLRTLAETGQVHWRCSAN